MKKFLRAAASAAALCALAFTCSCSGGEKTNYFKNLYSMGVYATVTVPQTDSAFSSCSGGEEERFLSLADEVYSVMNAADNSLSATLVSSCIYKFNNAAAGSVTEIDKIAYDVLAKAKELYELTGGYYNPAVYHSVKLYGFPLGNSLPQALPDESAAEAFRSLASHFGEVELSGENGKYYVRKPDCTVTVNGAEYSLAVDLGGIGKGWVADEVGSLMSERGFNYGLFNFSNSSMSVKRYAFNGDGLYTLEPRDPRGSDSFCSVKIADCNLSTSGDYEQFYEIGGVRYCHIIDPFTGSPVQTGVASVTVIGGSATEDDAFTTALSCMGKQKAVEFINGNLADRTVIMLVFEDGQGRVITNRPQEITIKNADYVLANGVENGRIVL